MNNTIISDFLELNRQISFYGQDKKRFKFYYNFKRRIYRKRLISKVSKIDAINTPLHKDSIFELASYVYANYMPDGSYKSIDKVLYYPTSQMYDIFVTINNVDYEIDVTNIASKMHLTLTIHNGPQSDIYEINSNTLETANKTLKSYVEVLNQELVNVISMYVLDTLNGYEGKENEI